jgi:hypothetical protein
MLMAWRCGSMIGLPDMRPSSLRKAMTEPVKVIAPMATPSDISNRLACGSAPARRCRRLRRIERAAATSTAARPTSEWKAATSCGIAVMHDAARIGADAAADGDAPITRSQLPTPGGDRQRRHDGDRHADHAEEVALPLVSGMRQAAQRQDEQDAGDEVEKGCEIGAHRLSPSSCTWRACAG